MFTHPIPNASRKCPIVPILWFSLSLTLVGALTGCPDRTPPAKVTAFVAVPGDTKIDLMWTNPTDADFAGVAIVRKTDGYPASVSDGETIYDDSGVMASDESLTNGTRYYYAAFAYDAGGNYASSTQATAIPTVGAASAEIVDGFEAVAETLASADIPAAARTQLESDFNAAESSYRAGDTCGAADYLEQYEDEAQALRQAASSQGLVGTYEELYVAGRRLRYVMVSTTSAKQLCPGQARVGEQANAAVDDAHNDNTEAMMTVTFGEPILMSSRHNGEVFTHVEIPGCDSLTGEPGRPSVPMFRRLLAVPQGAEVQVDCTYDEAETIYLNVLPTQPPPVDQGLPPVPGTPPDASVFANKPFTRNDTYYMSDAMYPADACTITELDEMRDVRTFLVEVPAGRYNAMSDSLTLLDSITIHTSFTGGSGAFATTRLNSAFESSANLYTSAFVNASAIQRHITAIDYAALFGQELMILTPPQFRAAADTLAEWKNEKGIVTRVFEVGVGTTTDTADEIVTFIKNDYNSKARIRTAYVLLLGNTAFIPCHYLDPNGEVGADTIGTDWPYTAFGLFGIMPQVALGRLPVRSLTAANFVVDRIIDYEKTPPVSARFYGRAAVAAQFQCCDTAGVTADTVGTDQRTFILSAEFARNAMRGDGKIVDRIYRRTVDADYTADTTPRRYRDGTPLPTALGPGSGFNWNSGTAEIRDAWNDGRFLFIHRDHGWPGGWGDPPFVWSDADALTNGDLLPVVFSVNCASGLFDQETAGGAISTMPGIPYFAERLLVNPNGGAIGILGDTRNSPTWANSALLRGFVDAVWPNAIPTFSDGTSHRRLGDILNHGKVYLFTQAGLSDTNITWSDVGDEFKMWHCIGDPTLELWTEDPNPRFLSRFVDVRLSGASLFADYETNGALLTAYQFDGHQVLQPLGRGTVVNGVAQFELVATPRQGAAVVIAASQRNVVSELLNAVVPDITPPGNVRNFAASVGQLIQVTLTWAPPFDGDYAGVKILRKTTGYPTSPNDGVTVYNGAGTSHIDITVSNNNDYYYRAFAYDTSGNFAPGASAHAEVFILIVN